MHKLTTFFIFLFSFIFLNETFAQEEYKKFYYENGVLSSEGFLENNKPIGFWKTYHKNGKLKSTGNRKNYLLDSVWCFYDEKQKIQMSITYALGKKNGLKKIFDEQENYIANENYINDSRENIAQQFFLNGKIKAAIPFKEDKENGIGFEYDTLGNIVTIVYYKLGFIAKQERINKTDFSGKKQGLWKTFHDSTLIVKTESNYENDLLNGFYKEFDRKGSLIKIEKYINGKKQEKAKEVVKLDIRTIYDENGKLKETYTITKDGKKQGAFRTYSDSGTVNNSKIYVDDELVAEGILDTKGTRQGFWTEYYSIGLIKSKGEYKDGIKIGEWIYYHLNGEIEQKGKYTKKGRPDGKWFWYFDNKQLQREETYSKGVSEGDVKEYDYNGALILKGQYEEGQEVGEWIFDMGDYIENGNFKAGQKDGLWEGTFKVNNKLAFKGNYIDGNANGKHVYYFTNGNERITGEYIMGNKEGAWTYMFQNEKEPLQIIYNSGNELKIDGIDVQSK